MANSLALRTILSIFVLALTQFGAGQTVVQNPTLSQTINQPSGTTFTVNGVQSLLWPNLFRIANEGNTMVFRDMSQTDAWFMIMRNDGSSTGDIQFFGNFTNSGTITPNPPGTGSIGTTASPWALVEANHVAGTNVTGQTANFAFLSKGAGSFKIDHPLDPLHKTLQHSFVESPDMKNIYDGIVTLDQSGEAWIMLPNWFEALNQDYRYQLTPIGAPASGLYISQEVVGNRFKISGGKTGLKVSWQVTGIRHDAFANAHRIKVEENKPADLQGKYLYPEVFHRQDTDRLAKEQQAPIETSNAQGTFESATHRDEGNQNRLN